MTCRILYAITDSGIGGTEKVLQNLLLRLDRAEFDPRDVVVMKGRRDMAELWEKAGVPVQTLGIRRWPTPAALGHLRAIIREKKPRIVHAFLYHSIQSCRIARFFNRSFSLVTSPRVNYRFASAPALLLDRSLRGLDDAAVCESEAGRKSLIHSGYDPEKVKVAWNSVDASAYAFNGEARERLRREWNVREEELLVGGVGRLHRQKGFDLFIRALTHLGKGPVKFRAALVGSGPERTALEKLARDLAVPVLFAGERRDVPSILSAFDVFVQSSRYEGLSNALLEAMSCGRPCAATAVDGTLDFAKDGENLVLAKPGDELSLAVAIGVLLEKPELRKKVSAHAKITAHEFSVDRMIQGFAQAYRFVLNQ